MRILLVGLLAIGCGVAAPEQGSGEALPVGGSGGQATAGATQGGQATAGGGSSSAGSGGAPSAGTGGSHVDPCTMGYCPNGGGAPMGGSDSQGGSTSDPGGAAEAGGAPNECTVPAEIQCAHDNPGSFGPTYTLNTGEMYAVGDRVTYQGKTYECYRDGWCSGGAVGNVMGWKLLYWDGCDWFPMCEVSDYDSCITYERNDYAIEHDSNGKVVLYFCNKSDLCNQHDPSEGATYYDSGTKKTISVWNAQSADEQGYPCQYLTL